MSLSLNELPGGLYMIVKPVPEVGALPFDCVNIEPDDRHRHLLQRFIDDHDVKAILARSAIQAVPGSAWMAIPPPAEIRRRWRRPGVSGRSDQVLRMV